MYTLSALGLITVTERMKSVLRCAVVVRVIGRTSSLREKSHLADLLCASSKLLKGRDHLLLISFPSTLHRFRMNIE